MTTKQPSLGASLATDAYRLSGISSYHRYSNTLINYRLKILHGAHKRPKA